MDEETKRDFLAYNDRSDLKKLVAKLKQKSLNSRMKYVLGIVAEIKIFLRITKNNLWSLLATTGKRVHLHTLVDRERKRSIERG